MNNSIKKNNKGFSLVELIVVIAIMVVLVAVLAPVFTKYVEQSRRATDVSNAQAIAEAVLADAADGVITGGSAVVASGTPTAIASDPKTQGNAVAKGATFTYDYNATTNVCSVYVTSDTSKTYNLATESGATAYKNKQ